MKVTWILAILVALTVTMVPQARAGQAQTVCADPCLSTWDVDMRIVAADQRPIRDSRDLIEALSKPQPGGMVYLTVAQTSPSGVRRVFTVAFSVGDTNASSPSSATIQAGQNAPESERYYEMISGCVNCEIPGIMLGGARVQLLIDPAKQPLLTVTQPAEGTLAYRAGIRCRDQIVEINGDPVDNMTVTEAIQRLRGPQGSQVTLTMARTVGPDKSFTVTLPRD